MYEFERQKGESAAAYSSFVDYREGKIDLKVMTKRKQRQIAEWETKWNWISRKSKYEEYLLEKINDKVAVPNQTELQQLLIELKNTLTNKIKESEIDELTADNLAKLISLISKAVTDITKAEKELEVQHKTESNWGEVSDKIRNNPKAMKLAEELSGLVF